MLSIAKLTSGQERYYLGQAGERVDVVTSVAGGAEDYYDDGNEAPGGWLGSAARRLGAVGRVDGDALRAVLAGRTPDASAQLRERPVKVAAYDLTFSAPKSVSVLFALGDEHVRDAVRSAQDRAVVEAFGYLERSAARVRRGAGGCVALPAEGFLAAAFRHRSSRLGDPQLHTHVVLANLACGSDGRWTALDGRPIYAHGRAASFLYQAVLRGELTRALGVEWTPVRKGIAEIAGVPERVMRAFSRRRAQIEAALDERGLEGPRASETAALATRRGKTRTRRESLEREWRRRAAMLGFPAERVDRLLGRTRSLGLDEDGWEAIGTHLAGPDGLTAARSSFSRHDVIEAVAAALPPGLAASAGDVELLADRFLQGADVVPLLGPAGEDDPASVFVRRDGRVMPADPAGLRYSTRELLLIERRLVDGGVAGQGRGAGLAGAPAVERALADRPTLSAEQAAMVRSLVTSGDRVSVVVGRAGTGKTFALGACREAWRSERLCVMGAAVARHAARELEDQAGVPSTSIAALVGSLDRGAPLPTGAVLVVDEAGMAGTRDLARLLGAVEAADGKLVLVGDHRQLPSIDAGGAFHALARRLTPIELTVNRRQIHAWERDAIELLRAGDGHKALERYRDHDRLHVEPTGDAARERLVRDWWQAGDPGANAMIALRRADVDELNKRAHELMRATGALAGPVLELPAGPMAAGDRILLRRNDLGLGVCNGDRGRVMSVDCSAGTLDLDIAGRRLTLPPHYLNALTDRGHPGVSYGYAITGHAAQGVTVDRAFVLADSALTREWGYTALTRGREANHLYVPEREELARHDFGPGDGQPVDAVERLACNLSTSRVEILGVERVQDPKTERARRAVADLQRERDALRIAVAAARQQRADLEASPLRRFRRGRLTGAVASERELARELAGVERRLERASQELQRHRTPERDLVARSLVRDIERRHDAQLQRGRRRDHGRSIGL